MPKTRKVSLGAAGQSPPIQGGRVVKSPPYYPMARATERWVIKMGILIYVIEKKLAAPAANRLLVSRGLLSTAAQVDFQMTMFLIKKEKAIDPTFLGASMSYNKLQMISHARNDAAHENLASILINETAYLSVLREFCSSSGDNSAATEAHRLITHANNGNFQSALSFQFWFTGVYNDHTAHCLSVIVYAVMVIYLAVSLFEFRQSRHPLAIQPPPMDSYENLKFFQQEQWKNVDYLGPGGARRRDRQLIQACIDARMDNRHSRHQETFTDWVTQLDDIVRLLDIMGFNLRARAVENVRNTLITARRHGSRVTSGQFPSLFQ